MTAPTHTLAQLHSGALAGARRLTLREGLQALPPAVYDLADTLEVLDLSGNALRRLPDDLHRLHRLRVLFCSGNPFTELPAVLGRCTALEMVGFKGCSIERVAAEALPVPLRWLILTDNRIATLPEALGERPRLQKLMLAGNRLRELPASLAACERLELVRIAANAFEALPPMLLALPRLAWLAYAGNPFSDILEAEAAAAHPGHSIDWAALHLGEKLGEGASGVIHQAAWQPEAGPPVEVAVKLFKGAMTSDGLPRSEMSACIAAGVHPNLIGVEGRIANHPDGALGLVMQRLAPHFRTLAAPPSLDSCTRDVYPPQLRLSPAAALRLARGITSAVSHLHARGILHGDVYAHNIGFDDDGQAVLGDFGAASFLPQHDAAASQALRGIEARAVARLMHELLALCAPTAGADVEDAALSELRAMAAAAG